MSRFQRIIKKQTKELGQAAKDYNELDSQCANIIAQQADEIEDIKYKIGEWQKRLCKSKVCEADFVVGTNPCTGCPIAEIIQEMHSTCSPR